MKITKIHIINFLKLKDVEFNPSKTSVIVGRNKMGKTSILKAIRAAFDGKIDESSIRIGENKAEIVIDLDDRTLVGVEESSGKRNLIWKGGSLSINKLKPILRPLSDMTTVEVAHVEEIAFSSFNAKVHLEYLVRYDAQKIAYLLSRHFDLS